MSPEIAELIPPDPELDQLIADFIARNNCHVYGNKDLITPTKVYRAKKRMWFPRSSAESQSRNSPCSCGSGKKYKKCCMP